MLCGSRKAVHNSIAAIRLLSDVPTGPRVECANSEDLGWEQAVIIEMADAPLGPRQPCRKLAEAGHPLIVVEFLILG